MSKNNLWVEKYRPHTVNDYVFIDPNLKTQVEHWIKEKTFPHLLLHGPAGTGKTTLGKLIIDNISTINSHDIMFANGSKEGRYVTWVDKLIAFVQTMPFGDFKVVFIDEADYLGKDTVQPAMRNLIEDYSESVRFIMTCNTVNKILPPIRSRCHEIHIHKCDINEFTARAATILVTENVNFDLDTLDNYVRASYPDLRRCLNLLQPNSITGTLQAISCTSIDDNDEYLVQAVTLFKAKKFKQARQLICNNAKLDEVESIFKWAYNNLDLWGSSDQAQDQAISIIRTGLLAAASCIDHEVNLSATFAELSNIGQP